MPGHRPAADQLLAAHLTRARTRKDQKYDGGGSGQRCLPGSFRERRKDRAGKEHDHGHRAAKPGSDHAELLEGR